MWRLLLAFSILFTSTSFAGSDVDDVVKKNISQINNFAAESILDFLGGPGAFINIYFLLS